MGIDPNTLPDHVQDQIRRKAKPRKAENALQMIPKAQAVPHDDRLNKTERLYAEHLQKRLINGDISDWMHEPFNLRLADRTFYKPDFVVLSADGYIEIHEVKGRWRDDALVKIKVAAENHPWFTFKAVFKKNGHWKVREFSGPKTGSPS